MVYFSPSKDQEGVEWNAINISRDKLMPMSTDNTWAERLYETFKYFITKISTYKLFNWFLTTLSPSSKYVIWESRFFKKKQKGQRNRSGREQTGGGGRRPRAPKPALSLPAKLIKSKKGKSVGFEGTGLNLPFHNTKRGASGSPNTKSSFNPLSTWNNHIV